MELVDVGMRDNDTEFFRATAAPRCTRCRLLVGKWAAPLDGLVIKRRRYDLSTTYDGLVVASARFCEACRQARITGLRFAPLPDDSAFNAVMPTRQVRFDSAAAGTRFLNPCRECGRFESVVGTIPACAVAGESVAPLEIVRSDLEFGSGDGQSPLFLCDLDTARVLARAGLKGLELQFPR